MIKEVESGRMTQDNNMGLNDLRKARCELDTNEKGWFSKYIDPAGATEIGRAVGECSKIPDGLLTFSVDAEIRTIRTLTVPGLEPGSIGDIGKVWGMTIFSYPMFRTGYFVLANTASAVISDAIALEFTNVLNSLYEYRDLIRSGEWLQLGEHEDWFWMVEVLPPTFDTPDPLNGPTRTLTDWRMSYKSLTIENNAPKLADQGLIVGAHYALTSAPIAEPVTETLSVPSVLTFTRYGITSAGPGSILWQIPNLIQPIATGSSPPLTPNSIFSSTTQVIEGNRWHVMRTAVQGTPHLWQYRVGPNNTWYSSPAVIFAEENDIVTVTIPAGGNPIQLTSTFPGSVSISLNIGVGIGASASVVMFMDLPDPIEAGGSGQTIELPAYRTDEIAANNFKMEQFQIAESEGGYLVHRKMRNPVFELTNAQSFGPIVFTTLNSTSPFSNGTGLQDTFDANFSTGSVVLSGISHANSPIIKLYQGWEGVTNIATPLGQFGHAGLAKNAELLDFVDSLTTKTTGFYPGKDNFAATLCKLGMNMLRNTLKSEATQGFLREVADRAIKSIAKRV